MTTRWTTLLAGVLLATAACGDDGGGNNNNDVCGDGQKTGTEQCDDGNTTAGDGCSATCRNESSGPVCGDSVVSGTEQCDDGNTASGDGCSATCQRETVAGCGNGQLDANEDCDDGNATANDGCTACNVDSGWTCTDAEPSVCTMVTANGSCTAPFAIALANNAGTLEGMAMGDTTGGSSHVPAADCDGDASGAGNDLVYSFTLPDVRDVTISTNDGSPFDLTIRLTTAPCMIDTQVAEAPGEDGCSDGYVTTGEMLQYVALPAGTYYVHVDGYDATAAGAFTLTIDATATLCGNGVLDTLEECDDNDAMAGDGCNARCEVEPGYVCDTTANPSVCTMACGNGDVDAGEECDDDNATNGDGCSSACVLEYDVLEAENNNTTPQAITATNHLIKGSLDADDVDLYTFTLAAPARVEIETYTTIEANSMYTGNGDPRFDCFSVDSVVAIFPMGATVTDDGMATYLDDDDADLRCSYIGANDGDDGAGADPNEGVLPAGTYTIRVTEYDGAAFDRYMISVKVITAPAAGELALNEFMAADNTADTNCDGSTTDSVDEYVELVNKGTHSIDLTGVTIADLQATGPRHTFAPGPTGSMFLDPGKAVVVWGGGAPACPGVDNWFVATSGNLGLNDGGDTITVATGGGAQLVQYAYPAQTVRVSSNLDTDITGTTYMLHDAVTGHVGDFSPGLRVNGTQF